MSNYVNNATPINNKVLLKWSAMTVHSAPEGSEKYFVLSKTPLTELVKVDGYTQFKDRLNWLYKNYNKENYQLVWSEIDQVNKRRIRKFVFNAIISKADAYMEKQIDEAICHLGEIPKWITELSENQHKLLLDRAITCYGLEVEQFTFTTKQLYTLPERVIKEVNQYGEVSYYSSEELQKDRNYRCKVYNEVVGKAQVTSAKVQYIAEQATIRNAWIMAQLEKQSGINLHECREVEDTTEHNKMVPITDLQGPDSPYDIPVEFRDFLEPVYADEAEDI